MTKKKETMAFWESVCRTNPKHTKEKKIGGRGLTTISAQYQKMLITNSFGMYGSGWGIEGETFMLEDTGIDYGTLGTYQAIFWYDEDGEKKTFPIHSSRFVYTHVRSGDYYKREDDLYKSLATDALTKGISTLGFNADVFLGMFNKHGGKYVDAAYLDSLNKEFGNDPEPVKAQPVKPKSNSGKRVFIAGGVEKGIDITELHERVFVNPNISKAQAETLTKILKSSVFSDEERIKTIKYLNKITVSPKDVSDALDKIFMQVTERKHALALEEEKNNIPDSEDLAF